MRAAPFLLDPDNRAFLGPASHRRRAVLKARLGLVLLAVVLGLCLFVTGWAALEWGRWLLLRGDASTALARVVGCRRDDDTDGGPIHYVTYEFQAPTPNGPVAYTRRQAVSAATYTRLRPGQVVTVRYHNSFPAVSAVAGDTYARDGVGVGALMWLPVTLFIGWQIRRCRRDLLLGRKGRLLEGRVVGCTAAPAGEDGYKLELAYRFTAPGGRVIRGRGVGYREELGRAPLPAAHTPVAVLYLDDRTYKVL